MVRVTNIVINHPDDEAREYIELVLTDRERIDFMQIPGSDQLYAVLREVNIPCVFTIEEAEGLIGTELPGAIITEMVRSGPVKLPGTGIEVAGIYRYKYVPDQQPMLLNLYTGTPLLGSMLPGSGDKSTSDNG